MTRILVLFTALLALAAGSVSAQEARSFSEGPVSVVTRVRVHEGQMDNYLSYLAKTFKPLLEAQKEAGIITSYAVYSTRPRSPDDHNMYLVMRYPNMASFDGLDDRVEPLSSKLLGMNRAQNAEAAIARGKMREILGSEVIRELVLK